jgi:hypothetical protein
MDKTMGPKQVIYWCDFMTGKRRRRKGGWEEIVLPLSYK